eukprot:1150573-Pelagomonas_calceolata.AAC.4
MAGGLLHDAWAHQIKKAFSLLRGHSLPDPCKPGPLRKRRQRGLFILSGGASANPQVCPARGSDNIGKDVSIRSIVPAIWPHSPRALSAYFPFLKQKLECGENNQCGENHQCGPVWIEILRITTVECGYPPAW